MGKFETPAPIAFLLGVLVALLLRCAALPEAHADANRTRRGDYSTVCEAAATLCSRSDEFGIGGGK